MPEMKTPIKTINGHALVDTEARAGVEANGKTISRLTEEIAVLSEITESDNGKFLRVVEGEPKWAEVPNAEEVSF